MLKRILALLCLVTLTMAATTSTTTTKTSTTNGTTTTTKTTTTKSTSSKKKSTKSKVHVPSLRTDQCPKLQPSSLSIKCPNNDCSGATVKDDYNILRDKYKYSDDVRGFKWKKNAQTFEGTLYLGNAKESQPNSRTKTLNTLDTGCLGADCAKFYLDKNDYIKSLQVTYQRQEIYVVGSNETKKTAFDRVKYLTVKTYYGKTQVMPEPPKPSNTTTTSNTTSNTSTNSTTTSSSTSTSNSTSTSGSTSTSTSNTNTVSASTSSNKVTLNPPTTFSETFNFAWNRRFIGLKTQEKQPDVQKVDAYYSQTDCWTLGKVPRKGKLGSLGGGAVAGIVLGFIFVFFVLPIGCICCWAPGRRCHGCCKMICPCFCWSCCCRGRGGSADKVQEEKPKKKESEPESTPHRDDDEAPKKKKKRSKKHGSGSEKGSGSGSGSDSGSKKSKKSGSGSD